MKKKLSLSSLYYDKKMDYAIEAPDGTFVYPGGYDKYIERQKKINEIKNKDLRYSITEKEFLKRKDKGLIKFEYKNNKWEVYSINYIENTLDTPYKDVYDEVTNLKAHNEIKNLFGERVFDYSKPVDLMKHLINLYPKKDNITVLDFFAGSGTTGHAVMELNNEDNGSRKFILCTSNENNICKEITYQRLNKVINGYTTFKNKEIKGLKENNLKYLKIKYNENE